MLALLAIEGERSGYDLLKLVEQAIAHVWSPARSGLYAVLPRLARDGLASHRTQAQSTRPDKQLYAITPRRPGRARRSGSRRSSRARARRSSSSCSSAKLTTPEVLLEHVEQFVADTEARLAELRAIEPTNTNRGHDWFHRHLLRYGIEQAERELDVGSTASRARCGEARGDSRAARRRRACRRWRRRSRTRRRGAARSVCPRTPSRSRSRVELHRRRATVALGPGHMGRTTLPATSSRRPGALHAARRRRLRRPSQRRALAGTRSPGRAARLVPPHARRDRACCPRSVSTASATATAVAVVQADGASRRGSSSCPSGDIHGLDAS